MNALDFFTKTYGLLRNYRAIPFWVLTPFRRIVRYSASRLLPMHLTYFHPKIGTIETDVIVSFTSFPARINEVWQVVKSLKNQSLLPEKIILWLSEEQFPNRQGIPETLWKEVDNLFEIRMVEGDIRSHKKFYYVMQEYPEKTFVTCDDDIYYHPDTLKCLVECSKRFPGCVITNTARQITFDELGQLKPYNDWRKEQERYASTNLIQIGVGGVLYPPKALHELTLRKDLFLSLTPMADDIWLNCMARLNNTPVVKSAMRLLPLPIRNDSPSLSAENKGENKNDIQLSELKNYLNRMGITDVYTPEFNIAY